MQTCRILISNSDLKCSDDNVVLFVFIWELRSDVLWRIHWAKWIELNAGTFLDTLRPQLQGNNWYRGRNKGLCNKHSAVDKWDQNFVGNFWRTCSFFISLVWSESCSEEPICFCFFKRRRIRRRGGKKRTMCFMTRVFWFTEKHHLKFHTKAAYPVQSNFG